MEREIDKYIFNEKDFEYSIQLTELLEGLKGKAQVWETPDNFVLQLHFPMPKNRLAEMAIVKWIESLSNL